MSTEITSMQTSESNACFTPNAPGIKKVEYIPYAWVETWVEFINTNNTITTPIVLKAGKEWLLASFSTNTCKYKEQPKQNADGVKYNVALDAFIALDSPALSELFDNMALQLFIIRITDKNNNVRLVGNPTTPLRFTAQLSTGKKAGDSKGYDYQFYGELFKKAPFYSI